MRLKVGYELIYECPQPTPMILTLNVHHSRVTDLVVPDRLHTAPAVEVPTVAPGARSFLLVRVLSRRGTMTSLVLNPRLVGLSHTHTTITIFAPA